MEEKLIFFCSLFAVIGTVIGFHYEWYFLASLCFFIILLKKRFNWFKLILIVFIFAIFLLNANLTEHFNQSTLNGRETNFEIVFRKPPNIDGDSLSGFAKVIANGEQIWLTYKIQSEDEKKLLEKNCFVGEVFTIVGKLNLPKHATVENGFDFHNYLKNNKTHWIFNVKQLNHFRTENSLYPKLLQAREKAILKIKKGLPDPLQSYAIAFIFGDQKLIDENAYKAYQKLGVVHLFSISGAQVGLIVWCIFTGFIRIGITKKWSMLNVILFIPFYAGLTGFSPSVNRACGMVIILFTFRLFKKRISPLTSLCTCFLLYLFIQPYQLYSIGFQLSFSICCGLILSKRLLERNKQDRIRQMITGTLICQLSSIPIVIYHFYEISILGFLANLFYIPLFSFFYFPMTIMTTVLYLFIGEFSNSFLHIGNFLFQELSIISKLLSSIPFSTICFGKPSQILLLLICLAIFFILLSLERNRPKQIIFSCSIFALFLFFQYNYNVFFSNGEITFIDVGQGDSILIQLPKNKGNYLIDTGGIFPIQNADWQQKESQFDTGKDIILPLLKSKGIRKLDKLILTHADFDHIGGSRAIIENVTIKQLLIPIGQEDGFKLYDWLSQKKRYGTKQSVRAGDSWCVGDNTFEVIHPEVTSSDKNNSCIVLYAKINGVKFLFTGDADLSAEEEIVSKYKLEIDVLKAGHHGSDTSTGEVFLNKICPKVSIISVGEKNRYGHPNAEVINRLKENQVHIFRTDMEGSIKFNIKNGTFITFPPYHIMQ